MSFEKVFNLIYTAGFRLTGDHREAAGLVEGVMGIIDKGNLKAALKGLAGQYARRPGTVRDRMAPAGSRPPGQSGPDQLVQQALLYLPSGERLLVVLRDVLGLSYAEIGEVAGLDEPAVTRLLAVGRRRLADRLIPRQRK
jgi:hypothetical protein